MQGELEGQMPIKRNIPARERLIFALDVSSADEAQQYIEQLGDAVNFYKLGLQLFVAGGYFELLTQLRDKHKQVMVDLKLFDVPETVRLAIRALRKHEVTFATVHGNDAMLQAAAEEKGALGILAVTALTSLDQKDLDDLGFKCDVSKLVLSRARRALALGCDGVVSSGLEAPRLREYYGDAFVIITPGIRPVANIDDQKRTVDVEEAFRSGADYIVVGRAIRDSADPRHVAETVQDRISMLFKN
jgi:orotidine-5'-phosphate decarboxylase